MEVIINNQRLDVALDNFHYLNEGNEAIVYKYKDKALKIYKSYCRKRRLNSNEIDTFSKIPTKRIQMPEHKILSLDDKLIGYSTNLLTEYPLTTLENIKMSNLIEELKMVKEDIKLLGSKNIDIEDLNRNNLIYDGRINLIDPGSFKVTDEKSIKHNIQKYQAFVAKEILYPVFLTITSKKRSQELTAMLEDTKNIDEYIGETSKENETLKKYLKRQVNR